MRYGIPRLRVLRLHVPNKKQNYGGKQKQMRFRCSRLKCGTKLKPLSNAAKNEAETIWLICRFYEYSTHRATLYSGSFIHCFTARAPRGPRRGADAPHPPCRCLGPTGARGQAQRSSWPPRPCTPLDSTSRQKPPLANTSQELPMAPQNTLNFTLPRDNILFLQGPQEA